MAYSNISIPQKTIELLEIIEKHEGQVTKGMLVDACSINENWPRIEELIELELIAEEGDLVQGWGEHAFFLTNEGLAFLSDYHAEKKKKRQEKRNTYAVSAIISAVVAWVPDLIRLMIKLV